LFAAVVRTSNPHIYKWELTIPSASIAQIWTYGW
jgi:hypothetical protein